jgi:hemolysin III
MAARATLALKPGVWFRRGRLLIVSPDSLGTACPLSGRNSTYRLVQILEAGSDVAPIVVYVIGLVTMLAFSAAYNMWPVSPAKWILRRFDHSAIYLLIAGTYTPFLMQ